MAETEVDLELAPEYEPEQAATNKVTAVVGQRRLELKDDPRFARKVSFWHQFKALFLKDLTLQARAWAVLICQIIAPGCIIGVAGLMQFITNYLLTTNNVTIPGSGALPLPQALSMPIPCIRGPDDHPMECVIVPANIIPYLNVNVTEVVELINKTHFFPENSPFLREFEKFLEDNATSCDQLTLYNLPHYYYVNEAGINVSLGELTANGSSSGFLGQATHVDEQFTFATDFEINHHWNNRTMCANFSQHQEYNSTINVPFFVEFNSSYEVDDTITAITRDYIAVADTKTSLSSAYKSLYYLQPLNQKLYHHVLSLIKSGNYTGRVKPSGGVIFHEYDPEGATLHYTVVSPQLGLYDNLDTQERNRIINVVHNKLFLTLTNASALLINTFVSALPSQLTPITIDVTGILGGALFPFATSLLLPIIVWSLVKDKEERHLIMMEQNGLDRSTYWLIKMNFNGLLFTIVCVVVTITCLIFQLRLFTQTNFLIIIMTLTLWGFGQNAVGLFYSNFFKRARTAAIVAILIVMFQVFILLLLEFINVIPINEAPFFLVMMYPPWAYYRILGYLDNACLQMLCYDITVFGSLNLVTQGLLYLAGSSLLFNILGAYLAFVLPQEYGVRKSPFFPIIALVNASMTCLHKIGWANKSCRRDQQLLSLSADTGEGQLDEDVLAEEQRLNRGFPEDAPVIIYKLRKEYPGRCGNPPLVAVHSLSLVIERNQCFGLLGPNGAGKTTLISVLTGLYQPTAGRATVAGYNLMTEIHSVYRHIGVCPQFDIQHSNLTAKEHLLFYARLKGVKWRSEKSVVKEALAQVNLLGAQNKKSRQLSGGMKRRLSVAMANIGNPDILILDEPTTGLDPLSRRQVWDVIETVKQNRSVILTTHDMEEADHLCTRVGIMNHGKLRCLGSQNRLKAKYGRGYQLQFDAAHGRVREVEAFVASAIPQAVHVETYGDKCTYQLSPADLVVSKLFETIDSSRDSVPIVDWGVKGTTMEDVFLNIVLQGNDEGDSPAKGCRACISNHLCCC